VRIKAKLAQSLRAEGYEVFDEGTDDETRSVDYPDVGTTVAQKVSDGHADRGILICGTGIGMAIVANKFPRVRAAACYDEVMIEMSRRHNDLNVLCLPGDMIGDRSVDDIVLLWLKTDFEAGRHSRRVKKINALDKD